MITVRAGSAAIGLCLVLLTSGCSREQQDWRSAEAADTIDSYGQFIQRHPESELVTQARTRVAQLGEDRDWQRAGSADTVDAYREFISQHPSGKWAQEANIRIQNFSLGEQAGTDAATQATGSAGGATRAAGSAADASATAGMAVGGPRATPALPTSAAPANAPSARPATAQSSGSAGPATSASQGAASARPVTSVSQAAGARTYGLAEPGDAATPAGSTGLRTPTASTAAVTGAGATASPAVVSRASASGVPAAGVVASAAKPSPGVTSTVSPGGAAAAHVPPPPQATAARGGFGIQLGAFSSEASASAQWGSLSAKYASQLQGLQQHVVPANTASGRVYRLQATVGDEGRARAICDQLRQHGQACVAVLPH